MSASSAGLEEHGSFDNYILLVKNYVNLCKQSFLRDSLSPCYEHRRVLSLSLTHGELCDVAGVGDGMHVAKEKHYVE